MRRIKIKKRSNIHFRIFLEQKIKFIIDSYLVSDIEMIPKKNIFIRYCFSFFLGGWSRETKKMGRERNEEADEKESTKNEAIKSESTLKKK